MWVLSISPTHSVFTVVWANDSIIWLRVAYKTAFILIFLYLITGFLNIQISLYLQCIVYWQEVIWWQVMIKGFCISKLHCIFTAMCTDKKGQHIYHMEGHPDSINHNFYGVGFLFDRTRSVCGCQMTDTSCWASSSVAVSPGSCSPPSSFSWSGGTPDPNKNWLSSRPDQQEKEMNHLRIIR